MPLAFARALAHFAAKAIAAAQLIAAAPPTALAVVLRERAVPARFAAPAAVSPANFAADFVPALARFVAVAPAAHLDCFEKHPF